MARKTQMNDITSPELIAQINPENKELMDEFLRYLKSVDRSPNTIDAYYHDLCIAFVWNLQHNNNRFFCDWTKRHVVKYQNYLLEQNGNSPARVRRLKAALSSLSNFIENVLDEDYPDFRNIINKIESPVLNPVREKTVLTDAQVEDLLTQLTAMEAYDKACVLALAVFSGRRKAELVRFKVSDFDDSRLVCNGALYKSAPIKTKGRGSKGKMLECFVLAKQFKPYLDNWMAYRAEKGIESEWLFPLPSDPTQHLNWQTLDSYAETFSRLINVDFYFHATRHLYVTNLQRKGIPDSAVVAILGWTSSQMVQIYSDLDTSESLSMYFDGAAEGGIVSKDPTKLSDL